MSITNTISRTSLLTAALRALESSQTDQKIKLFDDPHAEILAGQEGKELLSLAIKAAGQQPAIAVRTHYIDQQIKATFGEGITQFAFLAAGLDTRAYRLQIPAHCHLFEVDRQEVLDYKKNLLKNFQPTCSHHLVAADLTTDFMPLLEKSGWNKNLRTFWLIEGLLMYLNPDQSLQILKTVSDHAKAQDLLVFDILSESLLKAPHMKGQLDFLKSIGAPWLFGMEHPERELKTLGWQAETIQPGEYLLHRWPFPALPRHIPNIPRSFFVKAIKE